MSHDAHDVNSPLLSMKELHETLRDLGIAMSYSGLSEFVGEGDIAEQLQAQRNGNRKEFLPDVVGILADFLPWFREMGGKLPQAPNALRNRLHRQSPNSEMSEQMTAMHGNGGSALTIGNGLAVSEKSRLEPDPVLLAAAQGRAQGLALGDRVLTAAEAAEVLCCSVKTLRQNFPPYLRLGKSARSERWRLSDLLQARDMPTP